MEKWSRTTYKMAIQSNNIAIEMLQTTDGQQHLATAIPLPDSSLLSGDLKVLGRSATGAAFVSTITFLAKRFNETTTLVKTSQQKMNEPSSNWNVTINVISNNVAISVQGSNGATINWQVIGELFFFTA